MLQNPLILTDVAQLHQLFFIMIFHYDEHTRIEFIKTSIGMFRPIFFHAGQSEIIPLLLEEFDVDNAYIKLRRIDILGMPFELARLTVTGALRYAMKKSF